MFTFILISVIFIFAILKIRKVWKVKSLNGLKELPLAEGGLPIFGHIFSIGKRPFEYFQNISYKIGPIYRIQIGWKEFIIMNNNDVINKCLKDQGDNFAGRWKNTFTEQLAHSCGLALKDKEWWATQRAFTVKVLKEFGIGKSKTEQIITKEAENIITLIKSAAGKPINSADFFSFATMNVICDFIMRKEFKETDLEVVNLLRNIRKVFQGAEINAILVNIFPIFQNFPKIEYYLYRYLDTDGVADTFENVYDFNKKIITEHRERFDPSDECQDLIDAFLFEQYKLKDSTNLDNTFIDWQLIRLITELLIAGLETTSTTLTWSLYILSRFPNIQLKMHEEIVENIGMERFPTMADKKSLDFCQAVMDEVLRFVTLLPLSLPHRVHNDTSVNGYFIPANTIIFTNLLACHRDHKIWEKPYDFYPEHFLNESGKYTYRPELIPFGVGKRICLGESLAKMEYFIFLVTIVQRYKFVLDDETNKKSNFELFEGSQGTIRGTINHKILFKERSLDI